MGCITSKGFHEGIFIAVVGRTGSGMSQFIHDATGLYEAGIAENSLYPFTQRITPVTATISGIGLVTLIDTPGFDYSRGNDEYTTFAKLAKWFKCRYGRNAQLHGVIYMHNIWNEELYGGRSKFSDCKALQKLCGPDWCRRVIFVNSHWDECARRGEGNAVNRENSLKADYWSLMLMKGSPDMVRYGPPGSGLALRILRSIIRN